MERYHAWQAACMTILTGRFKDTWDLALPIVSLTYRVSAHKDLGLSPFNILRGSQPRMPYDVEFDDWPAPCDNTSDYTSKLQSTLREIHTVVESAHYKASSQRVKIRNGSYRHIRHTIGDFVLIWAPKAAEVLPKGVYNKPKLLDHWTLPHRIVAIRNDSLVVRNSDGKVRDVDTDSVIPYRFYYDGQPSIPSRRGFTAQERRELNKDFKSYLPPDLQKGQMVTFPVTMKNGSAGFGIGKALSHDSKGQWNLHWYSNDKETLLDPFTPCWLDINKHWYCGPQRHKDDAMMTTNDYYKGPLTQDHFADTGFNLLTDGSVSNAVLRRIEKHPRYKWSSPLNISDAE